MISDECHSNIWWTAGRFSLSRWKKGKLPYRRSSAMASKLMIERTLAQRVRMPTPLGGAPKKAGAYWKRSDTILSGSRPQTLLYGPRRGRWADQGEWSESRTSEEDSAPRLEAEAEVQGEAQVDAPVEVQGEAQIEVQVEIVRPAFGS